mmetsp:Transcript_93644/g.222665  ORF Transcript_93644/g.222665 Transcript_93644/m.222665 type:complete len:413 (+) Transcript_93644:99-1337(+)
MPADSALLDRGAKVASRGLLVVPLFILKLLRTHPLKLALWMLSTAAAADIGEAKSAARRSSVVCSLPPLLVQRRAVLKNGTGVVEGKANASDGDTFSLEESLTLASSEMQRLFSQGWKLTNTSVLSTLAVSLNAASGMRSAQAFSPALLFIIFVSCLMVFSVCMAVYLRWEPRSPAQEPLAKEVEPPESQTARLRVSRFAGPPPSLLTSPCGSPSYRQGRSSLGEQMPPRNRWLCPSLVVPSGMELVFAVSELMAAEKQQVAFHIIDLQGQPLSRVVVDEFGSRCGIFLRSLDDRPLAWVRTGPLFEKKGGLPEICWPSGEVYGTVAKEDPVPNKRYTLRDKSGQRIFTFNGNFQEKAINVVNASGRLVCDTERCAVSPGTAASYFQVRVAPSVDAGLILCGLLAIDKLRRV